LTPLESIAALLSSQAGKVAGQGIFCPENKLRVLKQAYSELPVNVWDSHNAKLCKTARGCIASR
jgi:hypothetical protein